MSGFHIHVAQTRDLDQAAELYAKTTSDGTADTATLNNYTCQLSRAEVEKAIEAETLYVARLEGFDDLAGSAIMRPQPSKDHEQDDSDSDALTSNDWTISDLIINRELSGKGLAARFIAKACDGVRMQGAERLCTFVSPQDTPAHNLYERCGFIDNGAVKFNCDDPEAADALLMCKRLIHPESSHKKGSWGRLLMLGLCSLMAFAVAVILLVIVLLAICTIHDASNGSERDLGSSSFLDSLFIGLLIGGIASCVMLAIPLAAGFASLKDQRYIESAIVAGVVGILFTMPCASFGTSASPDNPMFLAAFLPLGPILYLVAALNMRRTGK